MFVTSSLVSKRPKYWHSLEVNRGTLLWKAKFDRDIFVVENWILREFRNNFITAAGTCCKNDGHYERWAFTRIN